MSVLAVMRPFQSKLALRSRTRQTVVIVGAVCMWVFAGLIDISSAFADEASKGQPVLPEPFTMTLEGTRPKLPEPFTMTLEATRPKLPEPFTTTLEATRPKLPEPFTITLEATRPKLPEPFTMTLEAMRPKLPEPFSMTLEATRSDLCEQPKKDLVAAKSLTDKSSFAAAKQTLDKIKADQCPNIGPEIEAERTRISDLVDKAINDARATLDACQFKDSRQLIQNLPEGPRRAALVERWNKIYESERKARDLALEATTLKNQGEYDRAIGKLREASGLSSCDRTRATIDKAIADIRNERDEGNRRCRVKYGTAAFAGRHRDDGQFECKCQTGFIWNATRSACIRPPPTVADGHPVCRSQFGPQAYAAAVNANGTFQCKCTSGYVMKNRRCRRVTIADGHRQCRSEFGIGAYAVAINANGTFRCQCRDGYRWTAGNKSCIPLTIPDGHAACQRQFGPRSRATGYRGRGSWNCYTPPPPPPPHRECPKGYNPYGC